MVDDLNKKYINGKPPNDFGEAGIFIRILDGVCDQIDDPTAVCDHNLANSPQEVLFGGTIRGQDDLVSMLHNGVISTPTDQDDKIPVYKACEEGFGPAADLVYYPCAAKKIYPMHVATRWLIRSQVSKEVMNKHSVYIYLFNAP